MSNIRSGQYKSRNLPKDFKVLDQVKSKPVVMLIVMMIVGTALVFEERYFLMGVVILGFSAHALFFRKNVTMVEFGDEFAVFYADESREDCCVIYYNEVKDYTYKSKKFDTDTISIQLVNGKPIVLKSLDKKKVKQNLEEHIKNKDNA